MPDWTWVDIAIGWTAVLARNAGSHTAGDAAGPVLAWNDVLPRALLRAERTDADGMPWPALRTNGAGAWRILWPVDPGGRTVSVWCKHPGYSPTPRLVVRAAPELGVNASQIAEATTSTDWQKLELTVQVSERGVLVVDLEVRTPAIVLWDNLAAG